MGDLRMALAALAGTDGWSTTWAELFQYRFGGGGPLAGHAVGNLVLSALAERHSSAVDALDLAARLLGAAGRVLPLSDTGIDIVAEVAGLDPRQPAAVVEVRGQAAVATTSGRVRSLRLEPVRPAACRPALEAVERAEWVVFGPGSLYTSVLPHLLVPEMTGCLLRSPARRVMVLNLAPQPGETAGYPPEAHLRVIETHAPGLLFDVVIADRDAVGEPGVLARAAADLGARLHLVPVAYPGEPRHDPRRLAVAFEAVFASMAGNGAHNGVGTGAGPGVRSGTATGAADDTVVSDDAARRDAARRDAATTVSAREGVFPDHEGAVSAREGEE